MLGCFKLFDIVCMSEIEFRAIEKVLDVNLAGYIHDYVTDMEKAGVRTSSDPVAKQLSKVIDIIYATIWKTVKQYTFHLRSYQEYYKFCESITDTLWISQERIDPLVKKIEEILASKEEWISVIPPREKEAYVAFESVMKSFNMRVVSNVEYALRDPATGELLPDDNFPIPFTRDLVKQLHSFKHKFYEPNEKKVPIRIDYLIKREPDLISMREGLEFKKDIGSVQIEKLWKFV